MLSHPLSSKNHLLSHVHHKYNQCHHCRNRSWKGHIMQQPADFLSECVKIRKSFFSAREKKSNAELFRSTAIMMNLLSTLYMRFFEPVGFSHHSFYPVALNWRWDCFFADSKKNSRNPWSAIVFRIERGIYHFQKIAFQTSSPLEQKWNR